MKATTILKLAAVAFAYAGNNSASAALASPYGLAVDPTSKTLYIADADVSGRVVKYDPVQNTLGTFVTVDGPFSVAVNNDGVVYVGIVGQNTRLAAYDAQAKLVGTFPVPPGDSPINLTIDTNNDVFMTAGSFKEGQGYPHIHLYNNDFSVDYLQYNAISKLSYSTLTMPASAIFDALNSRYSLVTDNGRMYVVASTSKDSPNIVEISTLIRGQAGEIYRSVSDYEVPKARYLESHRFNSDRSFASIVDGYHNILSTDPEKGTINAVSLKYPSKVLLGNLSSAPYGIAHDASRNRLYVAFPLEHRVRVYQINYTSQGGVNVPASLTHKATLY